jgi:surface carbohydrate biosynthesis protein
MSDKRSTLIIPVESQVRELDAKLLLACAAVERGFPVVMGSRAYVHHAMASFPKGVYLAKSMRKMSDRMFAIITKLGHEIVAWDEEGLVRFPDRFYYQRRLSAKALRNVQILLAWGNDDARAFRAFEGYPGCPIHVTGNPRIDLMRPELRRSFDREVEDIRGRYGDFVLVNTNFSGLNHFHDSLSELKWNLEPENGMGGDPFMAGRAAFRNEVLGHFKQLVPTLSRLLPDHKVVVRPHPSENHQLWTDVAQGLDNVEVVNHGNVHPWVIASRALIHNGCTTAVEAAILGTPAVAFQPVTDEIYDMILPNSLSHHAHDLKDVEKTVRAIVDGALGVRDDPEVEETLAEHVAALDGPLAADRIIDVLVDAGYLGRLPAPQRWVRRLEARTHLALRTAVKRRNRFRPGHRNNIEFHRHRFPGVTATELRDKIAGFAQQLGRFDGVRVEQIDDHIFKLSASIALSWRRERSRSGPPARRARRNKPPAMPR